MKNKSIYISMLILTMSFLIAMYVLKIFYPEEFVMAVENEKLLVIGEYIDNHKWAYYLFGFIAAFITYSLYCCAICRRLTLKWWEYLIIIISIGISILLSIYMPNMVSAWGVVSMMMLPVIFRGDIKLLPIVYTTHFIAQTLTLQIRNLPMYIQYSNSLFFGLLTIECYFWLFLFYILFNMKKEKN